MQLVGLRVVLTLFMVTLGLVFVKAFQQRNVAYGDLLLIIPTCYVFAGFDYYATGIIADFYINGNRPAFAIFLMGTAAWMACVTAVLFHKRVTR